MAQPPKATGLPGDDAADRSDADETATAEETVEKDTGGDTDTDTEVAHPEVSAATSSSSPGTRSASRVDVATAVGLVAAFLLAVALTWPVWRQHRADADAVAARETAVAYAQLLTTVDSGDLDANFSAVLNGATGEFKDMYTKSSELLRQLLVDNEATGQSVVTHSAIQSVGPGRVAVLLAVDQSITNTARPDPRVDRLRMKITMEKVDGRWLAGKVEMP